MDQEKKSLTELWKNKRSRSLFILACYFIFMFMLIASIRMNSSAPVLTPSKQTPLFGTWNNYAYEIEFEQKEVKEIIEGKRYLNKQYFQYQNKQYYVENESLFEWKDQHLVKIEVIDFPFYQLTPSNLEKFLKKEFLYATTTFEDGIVKKEYHVPFSDFSETILKQESSFLGDVVFCSYEKEMDMIKIEIQIVRNDFFDQTNMVLSFSKKNEIEEFSNLIVD